MSKVFLKKFSLVLLFALSFGPLFAIERELGGETELAEVLWDGRGIYYDIVVPYEAYLLVITGPDGWSYTREFFNGDKPLLLFDDPEILEMCDGRYTYQLVELPQISKGAYQALVDAREKGDLAQIKSILIELRIPRDGSFQTGGFEFYKGDVVAMTQALDVGKDDRDAQTRDFLIADDLIVDGSACIGFDCVNGESFGFDTIRLKENNLRIKFEDTSVAASFPSNDWQITINDSANGGQNKFSIDDISGGRTPFTVEARAPSHSLYVDDGGRVGFGTSTPVADLHVISGDSPTLRLEQNGSSGFAPQTWDVAGNETNFFIRDASNGSQLPFRIRPSAPTNSIFVDTDGDVGLGTASPSAGLDVTGTTELNGEVTINDNTAVNANMTVTADSGTDPLIYLTDSNGTNSARTLMRVENIGSASIRIGNLASAANGGGAFTFSTVGVTANGGQTQFQISKTNTAGPEFTVTDDGDVYMGVGVANPASNANFRMDSAGDVTIAGNLTELSDRNEKENFEPVDPHEVLNKVAQLELTTWNYIDNEDSVRHLGPMAQDFFEAFGLGATDKGISVTDRTGVAFASIKALNQLVEEKDAKIEKLEKKLSDQEARLRALEALLLEK